MLPVYILTDKNQLPNNDFQVEHPENSNYYIVASNGIFLRKSIGLFTKTIKIDSIPFLEELQVNENVDYNLSKIDISLCSRIKRFFTKVVEKHHSESCVILYYNRDTQEYIAAITQQTVSHSRVDYRIDGFASSDEMEGFVRVGTIHSHCDFQAFHSGVDDRDEVFWDGIHITFGDNHSDEFTISASLTCQGERTLIDPMTVIDGINHIKNDKYSLINCEVDEAEIDLWMKQIVTKEEFIQGFQS